MNLKLEGFLSTLVYMKYMYVFQVASQPPPPPPSSLVKQGIFCTVWEMTVSLATRDSFCLPFNTLITV